MRKLRVALAVALAPAAAFCAISGAAASAGHGSGVIGHLYVDDNRTGVNRVAVPANRAGRAGAEASF